MRISDWSSDVCSSDLAAAVECLEACGARVMNRELTEGARHDFPLRPDKGRRVFQKGARQAGAEYAPQPLDEHVIDAIHRVRPDRALVEGTNILAARIGAQEVADIGLRLQREILPAEVDIMSPAIVHRQQPGHPAKLGVDQAVTAP